MENHNIKPEKITKPIQLLAVWLIGLILMVSALLTAAGTINKPEWLAVFFSISAVAIIPLFLVLIFLLQTRFRPQMQEDEYYSKFLNTNTLEILETQTNEVLIDTMTSKIDEKFIELSSITKDQIAFLQESIIEISKNLPSIKNKHSLEKPEELRTFDKFIKETKTNILLNLKLDRLDEVISVLAKLDIKVNTFFGKSANQEKPILFLLAFGKNVDFETLKTVILNLMDLGLTHIKITESSNNLYLGSYGYKTKNTTVIDKDLLKKIEESISTAEIYNQVLMRMKQ